MNPHNIGYRMAEHNFKLPDPGTGEAITVTQHGAVYGITVAGSGETNTVVAPTKAGIEFSIYCITRSSGERTVTFSPGVNQSADTTVVFNLDDDWATFKSFPITATTYAWKMIAADGGPATLGTQTFDDLAVADDLTVSGTGTFSGSSGDVLVTGEGNTVIGGPIGIVGTVQMDSTLTVGAAASIATVSNGDGSTNLIPKAQVIGTTKATGGLLIGVGSATDTTAVAPNLAFVKSGGATLATPTIVADNEILGEITWFAANGVDLESPAARIYCAVDGTPDVADMPGELVFQTTTDGGEALATAMTISPAGTVTTSKGLIPKSNQAAAITTTRVLTTADSGGCFSVAKTTAYAITLPTPAQGVRFKFMVLDTGANIVTIAAGSNMLWGAVNVNNTLTAMTGTTLSLASGGSIGDWVEFEGIDATHYLVTGACIAAADITIA
jgi:hypothetical protein